jgi:adenine-specific DNA-methyltransferase
MKFLTGLLNSKLIYFWLYHNGKRQGEQLQIDRDPLIEIPIIQSENKDIIKSVDLLMDLNKKLESVNLEKRELIKSQIEDLEKTIDDEVYKLYGITKEEKKIIEESLK